MSVYALTPRYVSFFYLSLSFSYSPSLSQVCDYTYIYAESCVYTHVYRINVEAQRLESLKVVEESLLHLT